MIRHQRHDGEMEVWSIVGKWKGKVFEWVGDSIHGVREVRLGGKKPSQEEYTSIERMIVNKYGNLTDL